MSTTLMPTVFIVDDESSVCDSIAWLLKTIGINSRSFNSAEEFLQAYDFNWEGCLLIDIRMPGIGGFGLQQQLNQLGNHLPIIFLTGHGDVSMAVRALKAGAIDFVLKPFNEQNLLEMIEKALKLDKQLQEEKAKNKSHQQNYDGLTAREQEILLLIVNGKVSKQIAKELNISISSAVAARTHIMKKMQVKSAIELVKVYLILSTQTPAL